MCNEFGARIINKDIVFTFVFTGELKGVNLYHKKNGKLLKTIFPKKEDVKGNVCSIRVSGMDASELMYLYDYDGREHTDPYATTIWGRETWGESKEIPDKKIYCGIAKIQNVESKDVSNISSLILYKLHIRGFTMDKRMGESFKGNYKGILSSIPYFKKIGVNTLVFFPPYEFDENLLDKKDYWGYSGKGMFPMAPKASYFGDSPYDNAVLFFKGLSDKGINSIIEFCFNKNNLLNEDLIISSLRFWAFNIGVCGFKFLGDAVPVSKIMADPYLSQKILIFENIEESSINNPRVCVYSDEYLYSIRKLNNHMDASIPIVCGMQRRQGNNYTYINYVSKPNGFTLYDSFSYREKHNQENGEQNVDGNNYNFSDNCGTEGDTKDKSIYNTRLCRIRSSLILLMLSQSVPLLNAGDELLNSAQGNNNPYCQDNKTGWVNHSRKKDVLALMDYMGKLTEFRKNHSVISNPAPFKMNDYKKVGVPDISYHSKEPWVSYLDESKKAVGILLCGEYAASSHEDVMVLMNFHNNKEQFTLPVLNGKKWYFITNSLEFEFLDNGKKINGKGVVTVPGDSVTLLVAK